MNRVTTTIKRHIATAASRFSWAVLYSAETQQAQGERVEARAHRLAERWGTQCRRGAGHHHPRNP